MSRGSTVRTSKHSSKCLSSCYLSVCPRSSPLHIHALIPSPAPPTHPLRAHRSKALPLAPGEVVFTDPQKTALPMPSGKIAITGFRAEIVDAAGASVPLSEVYNHHWLVYDGRLNSGLCGGYLAYKFGVGAECRGTPTVFPAPYALTAEGTEKWGANIHLLRTVDLVDDDVKSCIECAYAPNKGWVKTRGR